MEITRRAVWPSLLAAWCLRGQSSAADQEWAAFLAWTKALPPGALPNSRQEPFAGYQKSLIAGGMSPKDADALVERLQKRSIDNPEWMAVNLDRVYSQPGFHRDKPNTFLVETVSNLPPGKALDLGMGEGRSAIYLAQQGWEVTGLDVSDVAVTHAQERAGKLGVRIDARVQDVFTFVFGANRWDLISLLYFYIPERHSTLYQQIANGLKPGGRVIVEDVGQPAMERLLQVRAKWESTGLHLLRLEYIEGLNEWLDSTRPLGRLLLQKPS
jgi:SAM-dependent methyltransferase